VPGLTGFENRVASSSAGEKQLAKVRGERTALAAVQTSEPGLPDFGAAPPLHPDGAWINSKPLTIAGLRGKVVLVDFWTYSCINCLRTLPHLQSWYAAYHRSGLEIVGVHTPEFAFEHVLGNVEGAVRRLHVTWPVALDNSYATWNAYSNQYWPAEYLIDQSGHVRHVHFGEGEYDKTEHLIRLLLHAGGASRLPVPGGDVDRTPRGILTPETYLGYFRLDRFDSDRLVVQREYDYRLPTSLPVDHWAYGGRWTVESERAIAGDGARLQLHFHARSVHLVLGGKGAVAVVLDGKPRGVIHVNGSRLYTLASQKAVRDGKLDLTFTPDVSAYAFTYG
jgi:thiol-disulfide isomerase/thioredoxin